MSLPSSALDSCIIGYQLIGFRPIAGASPFLYCLTRDMPLTLTQFLSSTSDKGLRPPLNESKSLTWFYQFYVKGQDCHHITTSILRSHPEQKSHSRLTYGAGHLGPRVFSCQLLWHVLDTAAMPAYSAIRESSFSRLKRISLARQPNCFLYGSIDDHYLPTQIGLAGMERGTRSCQNAVVQEVMGDGERIAVVKRGF